MEKQTEAPGEKTVNLAEAIKRILAADEGQLAERLGMLLVDKECLTENGQGVFFALCGVSLEGLLERLK